MCDNKYNKKLNGDLKMRYITEVNFENGITLHGSGETEDASINEVMVQLPYPCNTKLYPSTTGYLTTNMIESMETYETGMYEQG